MKNLSPLLLIVFVISCQKNIPIGTYVFNSRERFIIDSGNRYEYYNGGTTGRVVYSSGQFQLNRSLVTFREDSNNFSRISFLYCYYDNLVGAQRKLILKNANEYTKVFSFSSHISGIKDIEFNDDYSVIYTPPGPGNYSGGFSVHSKLRNAVSLAPPPYNDSITSNEIKFSEVMSGKVGYKDCNVLVFRIEINEDMFTVKTPPTFRYKHKKLIKNDWPVFLLSK